MYSTTHSIMYANARHHSLYPFLDEIIVREEPYDIDGMGFYPDSEDDYDDEDCICEDCGRKIKDDYNHRLQDYKPGINKNSLL